MYRYKIAPLYSYNIPYPHWRGMHIQNATHFIGDGTAIPITIQTASEVFPHFEESLRWWHLHGTTLALTETDINFRKLRSIGIYQMTALSTNPRISQWEAVLRPANQYPPKPRPSLDVKMLKALHHKAFISDPVLNNQSTIIKVDETSISLTIPSTNPQYIAKICQTIYDGPDTSELDESIGRINRALNKLEEAICLFLGHRNPKIPTSCPKSYTLGKHRSELIRYRNDNKDTIPPDLAATIQIIDDRIVDWRNTIAHHVTSYDAPMITDKLPISADQNIQIAQEIKHLPQPNVMINKNNDPIKMTPNVFNTIETEIIDAYATIAIYAMPDFLRRLRISLSSNHPFQ